jgi:hypothetical protein
MALERVVFRNQRTLDQGMRRVTWRLQRLPAGCSTASQRYLALKLASVGAVQRVGALWQ